MKMERIKLTTIEEYEYAKTRGYEPLLDPLFILPIQLRKEVQIALFGNPAGGKRAKVNQVFYKWVWSNKPHVCEETGIVLLTYSACYISHIISRGSHPEMAHDPRNTNVLSLEAHNKWENGNRKSMKIYSQNRETMDLLMYEYCNRNYEFGK